MKTKILLFTLFITQICLIGQKRIYVANYNLQNLFDTINDPNKNDEEFLPDGARNWTDERLNKKLYNLSRAIRFMNDIQGPDLLGVEEVEHKSVLDAMLKKFFCDKNYKTAYLEAPDKRGIDVGLIYNADIFTVIQVKGLTVELPSHYPTRLILRVDFKISNGDTLCAFVNHWPSRRGGLKKSAPNRIAAARVLKVEVDKIQIQNSDAKIIILGDFNDEPYNTSIAETLGAKFLDSKQSKNELYNLSSKAYSEGKGSFMYRSKWNLLDQIIVSGNILSGGTFKYVKNSFSIINPYFITTHSGKYKDSAYPTYGGRTYLGGFSDHFPVGAVFEIK